VKAYLHVFPTPFTYLLNLFPLVGLGFPLLCIQLDMSKEKKYYENGTVSTCSTCAHL